MAPSLERRLILTFWFGLCTNFTNNSWCIKLFTGPLLSLRPEKVLVWLLCCQRVLFNLSSKFVLIENKLSNCASFFFFKLRRFIAMIGLDSLFQISQGLWLLLSWKNIFVKEFRLALCVFKMKQYLGKCYANAKPLVDLVKSIYRCFKNSVFPEKILVSSRMPGIPRRCKGLPRVFDLFAIKSLRFCIF